MASNWMVKGHLMSDRPRERTDAPAGHVTTNGFAIASLVLGIVWLMGIGSILALVFGYIGKSQIDQSHGMQTGRGLAVAGIVLGWVGVGFLALMVVLTTLGWMSMPMEMDMMDR